MPNEFEREAQSKCADCGDELPANAASCPSCGCPVRRKRNARNSSKIGLKNQSIKRKPTPIPVAAGGGNFGDADSTPPRINQNMLETEAELKIPKKSETPTESLSTTEVHIDPEEQRRLREKLSFLPSRYDPLKLLGEGGMGTVFHCRDTVLERNVAIKVMNEKFKQKESSEQRFMREARAQASVNHVNVTTILNFGLSNAGIPYLVMEYLQGEDLREIIERDAPMDPMLACEFIRQACNGLHEAHAQGIVHRDLKPSNLMIVKDHRGKPIVKILDLGLAKFPNQSTSLTMLTGTNLLGTPAYMAPEQVIGTGSESRTDLYSLGVVLYEMLVGKLPFESEHIEGWLYQHLHAVPDLPSKHNPTLAKIPQIDQLVMWLLAKQPAGRPKSAGELAQIIKYAMDRNFAGEKLATTVPQTTSRRGTAVDPRPQSGVMRAQTGVNLPPPPDPLRRHGSTRLLIPAGATQEQTQAFFMEFCHAAEDNEAANSWQAALECWQRALAIADNSAGIPERIAHCQKQIDYDDRINRVNTAIQFGEWERADQAIRETAAVRPDPRLIEIKSTMNRKLVSSWLKIAREKADSCLQVEVRQHLYERLAMASAQAGALTQCIELMATIRKIETKMPIIAKITGAAARHGKLEELKPFALGRLSAAREILDKTEQGVASLYCGRALTHVEEEQAAGDAFRNALTCFTEAYRRGAIIHLPQSPHAPALRATGTGTFLRRTSGLTMIVSASAAGASATKAANSAWQTAVSAVVQAQAEAGLVKDALDSLALMDDPWIVAQTRAQLANIFARQGLGIETEEQSALITFAMPKMQALRAVAISRLKTRGVRKAEDVLTEITTVVDRMPVYGAVAAGWADANAVPHAETLLRRGLEQVKEIEGKRARFLALFSMAEPLLQGRYAAIAQPVLQAAFDVAFTIDDLVDRLRSIVQLIYLRKHIVPRPHTTAVMSNMADDIAKLVRDAVATTLQVRPGPDRPDCIEEVAAAAGASSIPKLATELFSDFRESSETSVVCMGLAAGMAEDLRLIEFEAKPPPPPGNFPPPFPKF